jgi:hypothetical protein
MSKRITLELSEDMAQTLADLVCCIGGEPKDSYRQQTDAIGLALAGAGVHGQNNWRYNRFGDGSIEAQKYPTRDLHVKARRA